MELIKRKIIIGGLSVSGDTLFSDEFREPRDLKIGIFLKNTIDDLGIYTTLEEDNLEIDSKTNQTGKLE